MQHSILPMTREAFLDIRTHGEFRVAVVSPKVRIGDPQQNAASTIEKLEEAYARGAMYTLSTELGISGYSVQSMFQQPHFLKSCERALSDLRTWSSGKRMIMTIGCPIRRDGQTFNCAVTFYNGRVIAVTPKLYLPNDGNFNEKRYFTEGSKARLTEITVCGDTVPFGTDVLIRSTMHDDVVIGVNLCQDLWEPKSPECDHALAGATVIANLSASPIFVGKRESRISLVKASSLKNRAAVLYSSAGAGESPTLAWDGCCYVGVLGEIQAEGERFSLSGSCTVTDICIPTITVARIEETTFSDGIGEHGTSIREVLAEERLGIPDETDPKAKDLSSSVFHRIERPVSPLPWVMETTELRDRECWEYFMMTSGALATELEALGYPKCLIGVSGGADSTFALLVTVFTFRRLGLDMKDIIGITMPGLGTSLGTKSDAHKLMESLGVTILEKSISEISEETFRLIGHDPSVEDTTFENVQAWMRKHVLFSLAALEGNRLNDGGKKRLALVIGTGTMSELYVGWCTYVADQTSHYNPNVGIVKSRIWHQIRWAKENTTYFVDDDGPWDLLTQTLGSVLDRPISPELKRLGEDDDIVQDSEEEVGPYELVDFFIHGLLAMKLAPTHVARLAYQAFSAANVAHYHVPEHSYEVPSFTDLGEIRRWLLLFIHRYGVSEFKRIALPDGPKTMRIGPAQLHGQRLEATASHIVSLGDAARVPEELLL